MLKKCGRSCISLLLVFLLVFSVFTVTGSAAATAWLWGTNTTKSLNFTIGTSTKKIEIKDAKSTKKYGTTTGNTSGSKQADLTINDGTEKSIDVMLKTYSSAAQQKYEMQFKAYVPSGYIMHFDYQIESPDGATTQTMRFAPKGSDGDVTYTLEDGNSYTIVCDTSASGTSNSSTFSFEISGKNLTFIAHLTNIHLVKAENKRVIVIPPAEGGSMTAGDTTLNPGDDEVTFDTVGTDSGLALNAVPAAGYVFAGYKINDDDMLVAPNGANYTYFPVNDDDTIEPVFVSSSEPQFLVGNMNGYELVDNLRDAIDEADANNFHYIIPITDVVIEDDGDAYELPSGVTLVIPNNAEHYSYRTEPCVLYSAGSNSYRTKNPDKAVTLSEIGATRPYVTFTLSSGVVLSAESGSSISVGGIQHSPNGGGSASVRGGYGLVVVEEGAQIIVRNGAALYAWGFIVSDPPATADSDPAVVCKSGSVVYEMFQITDYSGGSIITDLVGTDKGNIFPFSQYYVQNIEAKLKIEAGAEEHVCGALTASGNAITAGLTFIGTGSALFALNSGCAIKYYDYEKDKLICRLDEGAQAAINPMALNVGVDLDTNNFQLPISNIGVEIAGDSSVEINQDLQLYPDSYVTLEDGSSLDINSNVYVADKATIEGHVMGNVSVKPMVYSATLDRETGNGKSQRTAASLAEPYVVNDGEVTINPNSKRDNVGSLNLIGEGGTISGSGTIVNYAADSVVPEGIKLINFYKDPDLGRQAGRLEPDPGENDTQCDDIDAMGEAYSYDATYDIWHTEEVTLSFVDLDNPANNSEATVEYGVDVTAPTLTKAGYSLKWISDINPEDVYLPGESIKALRYTSYVAEWTEKDAQTHTVTWKNADGTVLKTEDVVEGTIPAYTGDEPTQEADAQYTYTFTGWSPAFTPVTGDVTYTATYSSNLRSYTITWLDEDGTELEVDTVPYGQMATYNQTAPTKASDKQYTYSFSGWTPDVAVVTGDATYTANYTATLRKYTIKFVDEDGTVLQSGKVAYGSMPEYKGATPTKAADAQYTYTFDKWSPAIQQVTGNKTYTATYTATLNKYTITFEDEDGTVLQSSDFDYGTTPTYNGDIPTKHSDAQYTYTFFKWSPAIEQVTGNKTYTATYTAALRKYTITFVDEDGTILYSSIQSYGTNPKYKLGGPPTKDEDEQNYYVFDKWVPDFEMVTCNKTYTASYLAYPRYYEVTLVDGEGNETPILVPYGETPEISEPEKPQTAQFTYTFDHWQDDEGNTYTEIPQVTGNVTYTAIYSETVNEYTYTIVNGNDTLASDTVAYGTAPAYTGDTPTKQADAEFTYVFDGWDYEYFCIDADEEIPAGAQKEKVRSNDLWRIWGHVATIEELPKVHGNMTVTASFTAVAVTEPVTEPPTEVQSGGEGYYLVGSFIKGIGSHADSNWYPNPDYKLTQIDSDMYVIENIPLETTSQFKIMYSPDGIEMGNNWDWYPTGIDNNYGQNGEIKADSTYDIYFSTTEREGWFWNCINVVDKLAPTEPETEPVTEPETEPVTEPETLPEYEPGYYLYGSFNDYQIDEAYKLTKDDEVTERREYYFSAVYLEPTDRFVVVGVADDRTTLSYYPGEYMYYGNDDYSRIKYDDTYEVRFCPDGDGGSGMYLGYIKIIGSNPPIDSGYYLTGTFTGWQLTESYKMTKVEDAQGEEYIFPAFDLTTDTQLKVVYTADGRSIQDWYPTGTENNFGQTGEIPVDATYDIYFRPNGDGEGWFYNYIKAVNTTPYTITWRDWNNVILDVEDDYHYGDTPEYKGEDPTRPETDENTYVFSGWTPEITTVSGNKEYRAEYTATPKKYTVKFVNYDDTVLQSEELAYGATPEYKGEDPTRAADAQYTYTFKGWDQTPSAVTGDATYKATYTETLNKYTVKFVNFDDSVLQSEELAYGATPEYKGEAPTRDADAQYTYTFNGWDQTPAAVTGNATYKATYSTTVNKYTVKFVNFDDTVLQSEELAYGATPEYKGEDPTRAADAQYTYTFKGWDKTPAAVTGNATYKATYNTTVNKYTVKFVNFDDSVLQSEELAYGATPEYKGEAPTREADAQYTYTFNGWDQTPAAVTGNATYKATYSTTVNKYTVKFVNFDDTVLQSEELAYGATPEYKGEAPTREADAQYTYSFNGWDQTPADVTGNATYKATYSTTVNKYTVKFVNFDDTVLQSEELEYGATPEYKGEAPTRPDEGETVYTFNGWDSQIETVTGNATYTAVFTSSVKTYTITWLNDDNSVLKEDQLTRGETPAYVGDAPTKAADAQYLYAFTGWDPEITAVDGDATYKAVYMAYAQPKRSLTLEGQILVNFYWALPEGESVDDYTCEFTYMGNTVSENLPESPATAPESVVGRYKIGFAVDAPEMTQTITATLCKNGAPMVSASYKAADYAKNLPAEYNTGALKDLLQATMNYGSKAQTYFGVSTDDLADDYFTKGTYDKVTQDMINERMGDASTKTISKDVFSRYGLEYNGASLVLNSNTKIKINFSIKDNAAFETYKDTFTFNGEHVDPVILNDSTVSFSLDGVAPAELDVRFKLANTKGSAKLEYAALDYVSTCLAYENSDNEDDQKLYDLTQALYWYNVYSDAYFG